MEINNEPREALRATRQPINELPDLDGLFKYQKRKGLLVGDVWHDRPRRLAIHCRRSDRPRVRRALRDASQSLHAGSRPHTGAGFASC